MTITQLVKDVQSLRRQNLFLFAVIAAVVFVGAGGDAPTEVKEIRVERIDVVEPDGRIAMVIANSERLPGAIVDGEERLASRQAPEMLFYNRKGDESGGLIYRTAKLPDGSEVGYGHLSFDQANQNQVVKLQYLQNRHGIKNGLTVVDRPTDITIGEILDLQKRAAEDAAARARLEALEGAGRVGSDRVFVGSRDRMASLELNDRLGRTRLRLHVTPEGKARIDFLDESGATIRSVSPTDGNQPRPTGRDQGS